MPGKEESGRRIAKPPEQRVTCTVNGASIDTDLSSRTTWRAGRFLTGSIESKPSGRHLSALGDKT